MQMAGEDCISLKKEKKKKKNEKKTDAGPYIGALSNHLFY